MIQGGVAEKRAVRRDPGEVLTTGLESHPAVQAWMRISSEREPPSKITVLKESRKSGVYRIHGGGPEGTIIAKQCESETARVECLLYRHVFPGIAASTLRFYGNAEASGTGFQWIFLEDAGERGYCGEREPDQSLAVRWLANLHTSTHNLSLGFLPRTGPQFYLESHLREGHELIVSNLGNPVFSASDRSLLARLATNLKVVASHWDQVVEHSSAMPTALVHADFVEKNIRIKDRAGAPELLTFDWETAGCGVPAADVALCPDAHAYWLLVKEAWPWISFEMIRRQAMWGRLFRTLASICWKSHSLASEWAALEMKSMGYYDAELTELMLSVGWAGQN